MQEQLDSTTVAQTGSLPYRGLAIREAFPFPMVCRMPFGDTADYQSAHHAPTRRRSAVPSNCALCRIPEKFKLDMNVRKRKQGRTGAALR